MKPRGSARETRYYGASVPAEAAALRCETLTDLAATDLVTAHLKRNHSVFGAIDKTLAGFFVLTDEGDDFEAPMALL